MNVNGIVDVDYGRWAGCRAADFSGRRCQIVPSVGRNPAVPLPGAEAPARVQERALAALNGVTVDGEVIAVVTHDAVIQLALAAMLGLPLSSYRGLVQSTGALNEVRRSDGGWRMMKLNSRWHLADLDTGDSHASPGAS